MTRDRYDLCLDELEAVVFDMDGVLIDSMPYHAQAWIDALQAIGIHITRDDVYAREGEPGAVSLSHFLSQKGIEPRPELIQELLRAKERLFKQSAVLKPFPGAPELVAELRRQGKRLAIVTGTAWDELHSSLPEDLRRQFEVIITGDRIQRGKPDPEPYQAAIRELGVAADKVVVIENAPLGVISAKAAGLRCVTVATSVPCSQLASADACFEDVSSLAAYLLRNSNSSLPAQSDGLSHA